MVCDDPQVYLRDLGQDERRDFAEWQGAETRRMLEMQTRETCEWSARAEGRRIVGARSDGERLYDDGLACCVARR